MDRAYQYMSDVYTGVIPACKWVRLAVDRQIRDLEREGTKDFPYIFVEEDAQHVLDVFDTFKYTKGKWRGLPWEIMPWQAFIVSTVYGWRHMETGKRRYRDVYVKVPRKNAKTELLIGLAQYGFVYEGEKDPEVYWFATKKEQAKIGWSRQKLMTDYQIKRDKAIAEYCGTSNFRIYTNEGLGFVTYLAKNSSAKTEDGPSPYYGIADEYHAHPDDSMIEVITSGMGARDNPLLFRITTAGTNKDSPCKSHEEFCENILLGRVELENTFAIMYSVDKDDDVNDPATWEKANPAYLYIDTLPDFIKNEWERGRAKGGTTWINFLTKNLNIWSDVIEHWIELDVWRMNATNYTYLDLLDRKCFGGLDLASVRDTNALALFFPSRRENERHKMLWFFWTAEGTAKDQSVKHNIDYFKWAREGYLSLTPSNAVDFEQLAAEITGVRLIQDSAGNITREENPECPMVWFDIDHINYDRKFSPDAIPKLANQGIDMRPIGQGYYSLSAPTKAFEGMIANNKPPEPDENGDLPEPAKPNTQLDPGCNAMADWQFQNIVIEQDAADNIKITKDKRYQKKKVDGMQAAVMAIAGWMDWKANQTNKPKIEIHSIKK